MFTGVCKAAGLTLSARVVFEVDSDPGPGTEAPHGHVTAQGAGPGLGLQAALQSRPRGLIRRLRRLLTASFLLCFLDTCLVTCLVTAGAFQG